MSVMVRKLMAQRAARRKRLEGALEEAVRQLKEMGALKIVVFGSYVSGTMRRWSDLDILVVMPSFRSGKEWFKEIYDRVDLDAPADILPFAKEELAAKVRTSSFIRRALRTGKVVYERRQKD